MFEEGVNAGVPGKKFGRQVEQPGVVLVALQVEKHTHTVTYWYLHTWVSYRNSGEQHFWFSCIELPTWKAANHMSQSRR